MASRAIWKGAISFGLVHVPVALHSATQEQEIDFDWLDKRSMDPVGYRRINKRTGKEITKDNIVKGVKVEGKDSYVVLSDAEIKSAFPKRTQVIEIETFVKATDVSFFYSEKPYYLAPDGKAQRVYALLREALAKAGVIGIARFVLHNKEHLAALLPAGPALMLGTLRWSTEVRTPDGLDLPKAGAAANKLKDTELRMAQQLIADMTTSWNPKDYEDEFTASIRKLVSRKVKAGKTATVEPLEAAPDLGASNVVDLTELLRKSLGGKRTAARTEAGGTPSKGSTRKAPGKPPVKKRTSATKRPTLAAAESRALKRA